jgi:hypothetical protein
MSSENASYVFGFLKNFALRLRTEKSRFVIALFVLNVTDVKRKGNPHPIPMAGKTINRLHPIASVIINNPFSIRNPGIA